MAQLSLDGIDALLGVGFERLLRGPATAGVVGIARQGQEQQLAAGGTALLLPPVCAASRERLRSTVKSATIQDRPRDCSITSALAENA